MNYLLTEVTTVPQGLLWPRHRQVSHHALVRRYDFGMQIRIASPDNFEFIEGAYAHAREFMQAQWNATQWPSGYPGRIDAKEDIVRGHCFLVTDEEGPLAVFLSLPGRMKPMPRLTAHGIPMLTTTSFTAWLRRTGAVSLGLSSSSRLSARTTCAATPTRTMYRCSARLGPSDSANVERSRSPTVRSASPTTGSRNH